MWGDKMTEERRQLEEKEREIYEKRMKQIQENQNNLSYLIARANLMLDVGIAQEAWVQKQKFKKHLADAEKEYSVNKVILEQMSKDLVEGVVQKDKEKLTAPKKVVVEVPAKQVDNFCDDVTAKGYKVEEVK